MTNNINKWMVAHKYADNLFAANYIFQGLHLASVPRFWMRVKLILLYRAYRDTGEPSKIAYLKAQSGRRPMELFHA